MDQGFPDMIKRNKRTQKLSTWQDHTAILLPTGTQIAIIHRLSLAVVPALVIAKLKVAFTWCRFIAIMLYRVSSIIAKTLWTKSPSDAAFRPMETIQSGVGWERRVMRFAALSSRLSRSCVQLRRLDGQGRYVSRSQGGFTVVALILPRFFSME